MKRVSRTSSCVWCGLCFTCTGNSLGPLSPLSDELLSLMNLHASARSSGSVSSDGLSAPIASKLLSSEGPLSQLAPIPCVLCQEGANAIDHWLSYCPVVHSAWSVLWKGCPPPLDWRRTPDRHTGAALRYLLFPCRPPS